MKKIIMSLFLCLLAFSCGSNSDKKADTNTAKATQKETLVTSLPPLKWLVQKIAGDEFNVISIVQPNMNHELFEPKPEDLKKLEDSKLYFTYNALHFENEITEIVQNKDKVALVLDGVDKTLFLENHDHHEHEHADKDHDEHDKDKDEHEHHHHDEAFDPHVWFSLNMMDKVDENIKNKLVATYPDKKETFEKNYTTFITELNNFKKEMNDKFATKTKKYFMVYHPALNYFLAGRNVEEIAVEFEGKEPSAKQIKHIIEEAKEHNITTILVQPQFPKQSIEVISKEIPNAKIAEFNADEENIFENLRKFVDNLE